MNADQWGALVLGAACVVWWLADATYNRVTGQGRDQ